MRPSLQLQINQQLTLTPQLQQAIKLLQLSSLELNSEIQEMLESNPMLELGSDAEGENLSSNETREATNTSLDDTTIQLQKELIPNELPVDSIWEDIYPQYGTNKAPTTEILSQDVTHKNQEVSLREHLIWQMNLTSFNEEEIAIATVIIDSINEDGMLGCSLDEIKSSTGLTNLETNTIEHVLKTIQCFDPVGVGAHNLQECLSIQLEQFDPQTAWLKEAKQIIHDHIDLLGNHNYKQLAKECKINIEDLKQALLLIRTLNPRPGAQITNETPEYIIPDIIVKKVNKRWQVELNAEITPGLRINNTYANLIQNARNTDDKTYLRDHLQEARWFLKSLHSRNETLLKVAKCIVEHQRDFLEYGEEAMKPLVLRSIAEAIDMHESTISRITTRKYMHTPRGIFELKYFFSSHVQTATGGECSSVAIRALIKKLIAAENPQKPLSDSKMTLLLEEQGIKVARRTIAKYREAMAIPPSNERKSLNLNP